MLYLESLVLSLAGRMHFPGSAAGQLRSQHPLALFWTELLSTKSCCPSSCVCLSSCQKWCLHLKVQGPYLQLQLPSLAGRLHSAGSAAGQSGCCTSTCPVPGQSCVDQSLATLCHCVYPPVRNGSHSKRKRHCSLGSEILSGRQNALCRSAAEQLRCCAHFSPVSEQC